MMALAAPFKVLATMKVVGLQSVMSTGVDISAQGVVQGSLNSLRTLTKVRERALKIDEIVRLCESFLLHALDIDISQQ